MRDSMGIRILANDGLDPVGQNLLELAGYEVSLKNYHQDQLAFILKDFDALLVRSSTQVRRDLLDANPHLKLIGRAGVGLDNIDVEYAKSMGIAVVNTPGASAQSVAELVFGHLIGGVRFLYDVHRQMPKIGDDNFLHLKKIYSKGSELQGKILGIVGFGRIGQALAKMALGVGMKVIVFDKKSLPSRIELEFAQGERILLPITSCTLDELYREADFISFHVPSVSKPLWGEAELALVKDGVGILNSSRGGVLDEIALLKGLNSGKISFVGLDVFENEPYPNADLLKHPRVSATPHIGASTLEAQSRIGIELAQRIIQILG